MADGSPYAAAKRACDLLLPGIVQILGKRGTASIQGEVLVDGDVFLTADEIRNGTYKEIARAKFVAARAKGNKNAP